MAPWSTRLGRLALAVAMVLPFTTGIAAAEDPTPPQPTAVLRPIAFPVEGSVFYSDSFGDPRSGDRTHEGNDLMGVKLQRLLSAADGVVSWMRIDNESISGNMVIVTDDAGWRYLYVHLNNDTPGTDDGEAPIEWVLAPGIEVGTRVKAGQFIGYMGDSGNAENTAPHVHFEIQDPEGVSIDPHASLRLAEHGMTPRGTTPGLTVALGDVDGDGIDEIVTGAPRYRRSWVIVTELDGTEVSRFLAYPAAFRGGVDVAVGDVDGDGTAEIITAPGRGGGPHVRVLTIDGTSVGEFMAYTPKFKGGVRVGSGDVDGDGLDDVITGPGPGGGPHVTVRRPRGKTLAAFMAFDPSFKGGLRLATADTDGDGRDELVIGSGPGAGPTVLVTNMWGSVVSQITAYAPGFSGGVNVAGGDLDGDGLDEILTGAGPGGGPHVRAFDGDGTPVWGWFPFDSSLSGGVVVGVGDLDGDGQTERVAGMMRDGGLLRISA